MVPQPFERFDDGFCRNGIAQRDRNIAQPAFVSDTVDSASSGFDAEFFFAPCQQGG